MNEEDLVEIISVGR